MTLTCIEEASWLPISSGTLTDGRTPRRSMQVDLLRQQIQRAVSTGWSAETPADGRTLIVGGNLPPEVVAETHGPWAETVRAYALTVQPLRMLGLLSLLECLARDIADNTASKASRHAAVRSPTSSSRTTRQSDQEGPTMAGDAWARREVLELDTAAAVVWVEKPERSPRLGGRWLVFVESREVWWEMPDGGYRRSVHGLSAFPGTDFVPASP